MNSITTIIVCPTPAGGHIEHACDLALATLTATGERATVLTRTGATDYLPPAVAARIRIREIIPPLVPSTEHATRVKRITRMGKQLVRLVKEHWRIRAELRSVSGAKVLVLEEARYPLPRLLRVPKDSTRICLMVHNALEHAVSGQTLSDKVKSSIGSLMRGNVDFIAVHGDRQRALVEGTTRTPVQSFDLPGDSYLNEFFAHNRDNLSSVFPRLSESFVCLGEIRANKGIEVAIQAAKQAGAELLIVGKAIDLPYLHQIQEAAQGAANIQIKNEFVSPEAFEYILTHCRALLLPYTQFDAQSGVLARAARWQVRVVAADLPSLREQAAGTQRIKFFEPGSSSGLANAMAEVAVADVDGRERRSMSSKATIPEWNEIAIAIQAGW